MNMNLNSLDRVHRRFLLRVSSTAAAAPPARGPRWVMTFVALFPLTLLGLAPFPFAGVAQGPEKFPCRACSPQLCEKDDHVYEACTKSKSGTNTCATQEQGNGCPIGGTCRASGGFCGQPKFAFDSSQDEAVQVFRSGGILPAGGGFYVATRGDQLLLRSKCGEQAVVAEIARHDVGRSVATMTLAGGG